MPESRLAESGKAVRVAQPVVRIDIAEDPATIKLSLAGKVIGPCLGELRRKIDRARKMHRRIAIDLSEVTLLDRHGLEFLAAQDCEEICLLNCPEYIEPWIARERIAQMKVPPVKEPAR